MGDYYDGEYVVPGQSTRSGPAAPPGGWCFPTINGKLTAVPCNQISSNSPQGTLLSSSDIRAIQSALNAQINAGLIVDGRYGPQTTAAVRVFQSRKGLAVTGIVDPDTRARLFSTSAITAPRTNTGGQPVFNPNPSPQPSGFSLSSLFSGDSTTLILIVVVAAVALRRG
jgi:peptidoglycan hydrolase-like protein with peptidoglycan-binding domain